MTVQRNILEDPFATVTRAAITDYTQVGSVRTYQELQQGSDEWLAARLGVLTASEMKLILSPTLKVSKNAAQRAHLYEILSQRITQHVDSFNFMSDDMMRGHEDEVDACILYTKECAEVNHVGFITNDKWGFTLGYSPDGLVGDDGLIECKSRKPKYQVQTVLEHVVGGECETVPAEYMLQLQTGLLVSGRDWIDFISYSGGLPMIVIRVFPDLLMQEAIIAAATEFEAAVQEAMAKFNTALTSEHRLFPTERKEYEDISI